MYLTSNGGELAVGSIGLDEKLSILAEEAGSHAIMVDHRIAEIAEHRFVVGMLHGELVLRAAPELRLRPVAASTGLAADEGGCRRGGRAAGGCRAPTGQELKCQAAATMVAAAMTAAMTTVRRETRPRAVSRCRARAATDLRRRRGRLLRPALLPGTRFGTGHVLVDHRRVHPLGGGECARASRAVSLRISAWHVPRWPRTPLAPSVGASDRSRCRLTSSCASIDRGAIARRSGFRGPAHPCGLARPAAAWTGMHRIDAEAKRGGKEQGRIRSADGSTRLSISMTCSMKMSVFRRGGDGRPAEAVTSA